MGEKFTRKNSLRLQEYDYRWQGLYFVTICTAERACLFGQIEDDKMVLNEAGRAIEECWNAIPDHFPNVILDEYTIMPNHIHGIIAIDNSPLVGAQHVVPAPGIPRPQPGSLSTVIRSFKGAATKKLREGIARLPDGLWQRSFHDRIIRDTAELERIRIYILENPLNWETDTER